MSNNTLKKTILKNKELIKLLCDIMCLSRKSLYRKLNDTGKFTLEEIVAIKSALRLSLEDTIDFFAPFVANYNRDE